MMKKLLLPILSILCLMGCKHSEPRDGKEYMAYESTVYQKEAPEQYDLDGSDFKYVVSDSIPVKNLLIVDSLMLVDTGRDQGILEILSTDDFSSKGSFLSKGNASGEFLMGINLGLYTTISKRADGTHATLFDFLKSKAYDLNLTECLKTGKAAPVDITRETELPRPAFWVKQLADSSLYVRTLSDNQTVQKRMFVRNGQVEPAASMAFAEQFAVPEKEDFNLLSTLIGVSPDGSRCVEALMGMNYINVYSPLDGEGFTICCGKDLDRLSDVLALPKDNRKYMFADIRTYDFGFAVLKFDTTDGVYRANGDYLPSVMVFDWDGKALGEIRTGQKFSRFDMDVDRQKLYVLDEEEKLRQYDLPAGLVAD